MRFQVPQFIEIESKIFGPLTLKQFIYLLGGAGIIFILYAFLPFFLAILFGLPIGILSAALAFYKVNNQPFVKVIENAMKFSSSSKVYIWKKVPQKPEEMKDAARTGASEIYIPKLTKSKLKDLAWSLDIKEKLDIREKTEDDK